MRGRAFEASGRPIVSRVPHNCDSKARVHCSGAAADVVVVYSAVEAAALAATATAKDNHAAAATTKDNKPAGSRVRWQEVVVLEDWTRMIDDDEKSYAFSWGRVRDAGCKARQALACTPITPIQKPGQSDVVAAAAGGRR